MCGFRTAALAKTTTGRGLTMLHFALAGKVRSAAAARGLQRAALAYSWLASSDGLFTKEELRFHAKRIFRGWRKYP
jgi:hypothetical protein